MALLRTPDGVNLPVPDFHGTPMEPDWVRALYVMTKAQSQSACDDLARVLQLMDRPNPRLPWCWHEELIDFGNHLLKFAHKLSALAELLRITYPDVEESPRYVELIAITRADLGYTRSECHRLHSIAEWAMQEGQNDGTQ